jgi:hypothetical protein
MLEFENLQGLNRCDLGVRRLPIGRIWRSERHQDGSTREPFQCRQSRRFRFLTLLQQLGRQRRSLDVKGIELSMDRIGMAGLIHFHRANEIEEMNIKKEPLDLWVC